jgi:hypothetical protein
MELFNLPPTTLINRVIPKKAFDAYATSRQRRLLGDTVSRISWRYKLSTETINLEAREIHEIQVFLLELKNSQAHSGVLELIDRAIPYPIIFILTHAGQTYLSTSPKHPHPTQSAQSVIDWTFQSHWFDPIENRYALHLKKNLDTVYLDFCLQLCGRPVLPEPSLTALIQYHRHLDALDKEINRLKNSIANCKQFNQKVELNLRLRKAIEEREEASKIINKKP